MDRAVITALEKRRYKPATFQGRPITVDYTFNLTLTLPQ
jgi:periplasmic protein TonB